MTASKPKWWHVLHDLAMHPRSDRFISQLQAACGVTKDGGRNVFLHTYFKLASMMGEEVFALIGPLIWVTPEVSLTYLNHFGIILTLGQLSKDLLQLPRPPGPKSKYPIERLEKHFGTEFGMPSTHVMSGFLPLSIYLRLHAWGVRVSPLAWTACAICAVSVAFSRLYMGVHSVADVVGGAIMTVIIMYILALGGDSFDDAMFNRRNSIYIWIAMLTLFIFKYPRAVPWSASIGTGCQIFGTFIGAGTAWCFNRAYIPEYLNALYHMSALGMHRGADVPIDASMSAASHVIRSISGLVLVGLLKVVTKELSNQLFSFLFKLGLLPHDKRTEIDADGNVVPVHKYYSIEVPVR
jgi:hypothetical protein